MSTVRWRLGTLDCVFRFVHDVCGSPALHSTPTAEAEIGYAAWLSARDAVHCHSDNSESLSTASPARVAALPLPQEAELHISRYHSWRLIVQQPPPPWLMPCVHHTDESQLRSAPRTAYSSASVRRRHHSASRATPPHTFGVTVLGCPLLSVLCCAATTVCTSRRLVHAQHVQPQTPHQPRHSISIHRAVAPVPPAVPTSLMLVCSLAVTH